VIRYDSNVIFRERSVVIERTTTVKLEETVCIKGYFLWAELNFLGSDGIVCKHEKSCE